MKREFVVMQVSAAPDGGPDVLLSLLEERSLQPQTYGMDIRHPFQHGLVFGRLGRERLSRVPMCYAEYERMGLKVGDRVTLQVDRLEAGPGEPDPHVERISHPRRP